MHGIATKPGLLFAALLYLSPLPLDAAPKVVVTLQPIHSLVSGVMDGVGRPVLLMQSGDSAHGQALKPSQAAALERADLVFWIGGQLERNLAGRLPTLAPGARVIPLSEAEGVRLRPLAGGAKGAWDMHIWLDPGNAKAIVRGVASALIQADGEHATAYRANAGKLLDRLAALEGALEKTFKPLGGIPFVVDHQAYGYLAARFGLNVVGAIARLPGDTPSARRMVALRRLMERRNVRCILGEWRKPPALVRALIRGKAIRTGTMDPIGVGLSPGPQAYFLLMKGLARTLRQCLAAPL